MKVKYSPIYSGLLKNIDIVVAEMRVNDGFLRQGSRVYLIRPDQIEKETCKCLVQGAWQMWVRDLEWEKLKLVKVLAVRAQISERCFSAPRAELDELVAEINRRHVSDELDFSYELE